MNINRNNYEEYFLLYADNELSAAEKNMVEMFVQQNPDLEEEFIMLRQSVVTPDNKIILEDKSSLFKGEEEFINLNNYEEKFLLYADNELSLSEVEETEKFVLSNTDLQNEFTLLQQVKYNPDNSITFPDKSSLYKKEKDGKIIPFFWKAMAAAVLLGIGLWSGITYLQNNKVAPATINNAVAKKVDTKPFVQPKPEEIVANPKPIASQQKVEEDPASALQKKQQQPPQNLAVNNNIKPQEKIPEVINKNKEVNIIASTEPAKSTNNLSGENIVEPNSQTNISNITAQQNNYAQTASYTPEVEEKSENYVFYNITQEEFRKSKLGIFFKKVKRTLERKNFLREKTFKVSSIQEIPNN